LSNQQLQSYVKVWCYIGVEILVRRKKEETNIESIEGNISFATSAHLVVQGAGLVEPQFASVALDPGLGNVFVVAAAQQVALVKELMHERRQCVGGSSLYSRK